MTVPVWATGGALLLPLWMLEFWTMGENNLITRAVEQLHQAPFKILETSLRIINFSAISNELRALGGTSVTTQTLTNVPFDILIWNMEHDNARSLKLLPPGRSVQTAQINGFTSALKHGFFVDGIGNPKTSDNYSNNVTPGDRWINMVDLADQHYIAKPGDQWAARLNYQQNGPYGWMLAPRPAIYNLSVPRPTAVAERYNILHNAQQPFITEANTIQFTEAFDGYNDIETNNLNANQGFTQPPKRMNVFGIPEPCTSMPVIVISMHQLQRERTAGTEATAMQILGHLTIETKMRYLECPPQWTNQATRQLEGPDYANNPLSYSGTSGQRVSRKMATYTVDLQNDKQLEKYGDIHPINGGPVMQTYGSVPSTLQVKLV